MIPAEWTAHYWQWIHSHKKEDNPLKTGKINITDDCVMLPCTGGGSCDRTAELTADKEILIPVFAAMEYGGNDLKERARFMANAKHKKLIIDSAVLRDYEYEYIEIDFKLGKYDAVAAGYWYRLKLEKGKHMVEFGGSSDNGFYTNNRYALTVI